MFRKIPKNGLLSNCSNLRANWSRYIPTEPLSHHYSPVVTEEAPIGRYGRIENVGQPSEINNGGTSLAPADGGSGSDLSGGRPPGLTYQTFTLEPQTDFVQKLSIIREVEEDYQAYTMDKVAKVAKEAKVATLPDMASLETLLEHYLEANQKIFTQPAIHEVNLGLDGEISTPLEHLGEKSPFSEVEQQIGDLQTQSLRNAHIVYELGGSIEEAVGQYQEPAHRVFPSGGGFVYGLNKAKAPRDSGGKAPRYSILVDSGPPGGGGASGGFGGGGSGSGGGRGSGGFGGGPHYILIIIFWGMVIIVIKVVGEWITQYGYKRINDALEKMRQLYLERVRALGALPGKSPVPRGVRAALAATTPLLLSGSALFVMSYLFTPERVREILRSLLAVMEVLLQELGLALVAALPHQLREAAHLLGHVMAVLGAQIRSLVENILIPALLLCRGAGLVLCSAYLFFKIFSGAAQLYKLLEPQVALTAATDSDPREAVLLFCIGLLKSASVFMIAFLPKNKAALALGGGAVIACCAAPPHYFQRIATLLLSSPKFSLLVGCVLGRWCCIILVGYMANTATFRRYIPLFVGAGYFLRVYELAMTATPNLLPS